ncbi:MAG: hypothetical protein WCW44_03940 [archaeon]|jgi:hypothetical protein
MRKTIGKIKSKFSSIRHSIRSRAALMHEQTNRVLLEAKIKALNLKREKINPATYSQYYSPKPALVPYFMMTAREEQMRGSTPGGFNDAYVRFSGGKAIHVNPKVPQIRLIPKEDVADFFLSRLLEHAGTREKRATYDKIPGIRRAVIEDIRHTLMGIDWAEKTYGTKVTVPKDVLEWIGKVGSA